MPIINPPITQEYEEDSWKQQATDLLRQLELQVIELQLKVKELEDN